MINSALLPAWPSARQFAEAVQCPRLCFTNPLLHDTLPAFDRLGMPLVTSGQFAYVFKLKQQQGGRAYAVRCFRGFLGDRGERYRAIDAHLRAARLPALAGFEYDAEGIFVAGRRFPLLVMEWIEGPTLDVYLEEVIGRREVLEHLADEWLRLMQALREQRVAHGDLQHGNVIVEQGRLRLVDLDGMYVPEMAGWRASEIGHQHYQHPARDEKQFDENLDNFSALVIYLSLISLAAEPRLWAEHHDENLIFTRADFQNPGDSALFAKIKRLGPEHRRFAELLERAAQGDPAATPHLLDQATPRSKLPSWMLGPTDLTVASRTREAARIEVPSVEVRERGARRGGGAAATSLRATPVTPGSSQVQSVFSGAPVVSTAAAPPPLFGPPLAVHQIMPAGLYYAKRFGKAWVPFIWVWLTLGRHLYEFAGIAGGPAILLTIITFPVACYLIGLARATYHARDALRAGRPAHLPSSTTSHLIGSARQTLWPHVYPPLSPAAHAAAGAIVASRTQGIYHRQTCDWAVRIAPGNKVGFTSPAEAQTAGYRRCKVCLP